MTKVKKSIWSKIGIALLSFALVVSAVFVSVGKVANADDPAVPTKAEETRFKNALNNGYIDVTVNQEDDTLVIDSWNYTTACLVDGFFIEEEQLQTAEEFIGTFLDNKALYEKIRAYYQFGEEGEKPNIDVNLYTALTAYREVWKDVFAAPEAVKARINAELAVIEEVTYPDMETFLSVKAAYELLNADQQAYVMYKGQEAAEENYTEEYETYLAVKNALEAIEARLDALVEKIVSNECYEVGEGEDVETVTPLGYMLARETGVQLSDETAFDAIDVEYQALPDEEEVYYTEKKYVDRVLAAEEPTQIDAETYAECPTNVVNIELVRAALNAIKARLDNIYDMIVSTEETVQDKNVLTHVANVRPLGNMVEYGVHVSDSETFGTIDGYYQAVVDETEKAYLDGKLAEVEQMLEDTSAYTAPETNVYNIEYVREALRQKEAQLNALVEAIVNTTSDKVTIAVMDGNDEVEVEVTPLGYILENFAYSYKADFDYVDGAYRALNGDVLEYVNRELAGYNQLDDETYPTEVEEGEPYLTSVVNIEKLRELFAQKEEYLNDLVAAIEQDNDEEQVVVEYEDGEEEIERPLHYMTITGVGYADKADFDFIDAAYAALTDAEKAYVDARVTAVTDEVYTNQVTNVKYIEEVREALTQIKTALDWLVQAIEGTEEFEMPLADIEAFVPEQIMPEEGDTFTVKPLGKMLEDGVVLEDLPMFTFVDNVYAFLNGDGLEAELAYVNERVTAVEEGAEYTNQVTNVKNIEDVREALNTIYERLNLLVKKIALVSEELEGVPAAVPFTFELEGETYPSVAGLLSQYLTTVLSADEEQLGEEAYATLMVQVMNLVLKYKPAFDAVDGEYQALEGAELEYVNKVLADQYREILPSLEENKENFPDRETDVFSLETYRETYNMFVETLDDLVKRIEEEASYEVEEEQTTYTVNPLHYMTIRGVEFSDKEFFEEIDEVYGMLSGAAKEYIDERVTAVTDEVYTNKVTDVKYIEDVREALLQRQNELDELIRKINEDLGLMIERGVEYSDKETFDPIDEEYQGLTEAERAYVDANVTVDNETYPTEGDEAYPTSVVNIEKVRKALAQREAELDELVEKIEGVELNDGELDTMLARETGVDYNTDKEAFDEIDEKYQALTEAERAYVDAKVTAVEEDAEYTEQVTNVKNIEEVREALTARETKLDLLVKKIAESAPFEVAEDENFDPVHYIVSLIMNKEEEEEQEEELTEEQEMALMNQFFAYKATFDVVDTEYQALEGAELEYVNSRLKDYEEMLDLEDEFVQAFIETLYPNRETDVASLEAYRAFYNMVKEALDELVKRIENEEPYEVEEDQNTYTVDSLHYMTLRGVEFSDKEAFDEIDAMYAMFSNAPALKAYVDARVTPVEEGAEYAEQVTDVKYIEDVREALLQRQNELDELVEKIEGVVLGEDELDTMLENGVKLSDKRAFDAIDAEYQELTDAEKAYVDSKVTVNAETYPTEGDEAYPTSVVNIELVRAELTRLIKELHDRINEVIDGENTDIDSADVIIDDHDGLDEEQSNDLADAFEGERDNYWQEFMDAYNKLRFAMFFKQAVQDVYNNVTNEENPYFTVEGYEVEKLLNSVYCSFAFIEFGNGKTLQDLVKDPCEEQLAVIDRLYEEKDEEGNLVHNRVNYAQLQEALDEVAQEVADLLDPENENSLAAQLADLAKRLADAEAQLDPETEDSLAAELAALEAQVADLLNPENEESLVSRLAALEAELDPETEGTLAAKVAELLAQLDPETEGSLAEKVADLQTALAALQNELNPETEGSVAARLAALEAQETDVEAELARLKNSVNTDIKNLKDNNKKEFDALKAENEQLKKDLEDKTNKLNKTMLIGLIALGVVAVALVACVAVLFGKTKALARNASSNESSEEDEDKKED